MSAVLWSIFIIVVVNPPELGLWQALRLMLACAALALIASLALIAVLTP